MCVRKITLVVLGGFLVLKNLKLYFCLHEYLGFRLLQNKKLPFKDIDTLTDEELVATIGPHGEVELTLATDNKCISTENDIFPNNPFAGLHHGSVSSTRSEIILPNERVRNFANKHSFNSKQRNIYENVQIGMEHQNNKSSGECSDVHTNNCSCLSVMSPFDEKAEWAEIADIMASFGGSITRESIYGNDAETHFAQGVNADSLSSKIPYFTGVEQWLSYYGLSQYDNALIINGFDDVNFLGGKMLEDLDLEEIGVKNIVDRQKLIRAAQVLPSVQPISYFKGTEKIPYSIEDWLKSICLSEYIDNFLNNNITDMDRAVKLWEVELNTVLKISKLGHRKRILASLGDKHVDNFIDIKDLDLSQLSNDLSELEVAENFDKQYYIVQSSKEDSYRHSVSESNRKSDLKIRSPTHLMCDSQSDNEVHQPATEAQWRHHPDELVINTCNYMAKYLGSTLVTDLKGLVSTKASIQKLKTSTKDIAKIPNIILSISYSGVKFIDAETHQLVCEHEIRNIHCACQDAEDLCHFAYITKEHQTHNHYCHVFSSHSVDSASEIILTLGQAFEVAYQIAVKEKAKSLWNSNSQNISSKNASS